MRTEWFFIWKTLNPLHQRMYCGRSGWNWSSGSWEEDFLICQCIYAISLLSHLGKGQCPSFELTWTHLTQGCLMPSLVEIGPVVLEKKICSNFINVFSLFHNYLPLEMGRALHLNNFESPSPKNALWQVWLKLVQCFLRRTWKSEKFTTTTTDNGHILIR